METIVIIGGGASGIISAISSKNDNNRVIILERNSSCLKKLLMTGNGKCNYYNDEQSLSNYYSSDMDIVSKIINSNNVSLVPDFFERIGIVSKKKNGYYYPFSNQASTIRNALLLEASMVGVEIICDALVSEVSVLDNGFRVYYNDKNIVCDKVVVASGSKAYPKTGSDGMGYGFLERLGHSIIEPLPALVGLCSDFKYNKEWAGIRSDVCISLFEDDRFVKEEKGEIQLTDYGVSGICTFNISHMAVRGLAKGCLEKVCINFVGFVENEVSEWLDDLSRIVPYKNVRLLLEGVLNYKLVDIILKVSNISGDLFYSDLSQKDKTILCNNLRCFTIPIVGSRGFDNSQVCSGGVSLKEINPVNFESLIVPGLYITGELLDITGMCGGYNLTISWLSGLLVGRSISGL